MNKSIKKGFIGLLLLSVVLSGCQKTPAPAESNQPGTEMCIRDRLCDGDGRADSAPRKKIRVKYSSGKNSGCFFISDWPACPSSFIMKESGRQPSGREGRQAEPRFPADELRKERDNDVR